LQLLQKRKGLQKGEIFGEIKKKNRERALHAFHKGKKESKTTDKHTDHHSQG